MNKNYFYFLTQFHQNYLGSLFLFVIFITIHDTYVILSFPQDKTQLMMLVTWVMELYLNQIGESRDSAKITGYETLQDEFRKFLNQSKVKVNYFGDVMNSVVLFSVVLK